MRIEWTTSELQEDFEVRGFALGLCVVRRKSDGVLGSVTFDDRLVDDQRIRIYSNVQEA